MFTKYGINMSVISEHVISIIDHETDWKLDCIWAVWSTVVLWKIMQTVTLFHLHLL